jgi:hypothetical protein
MTDVASGHGRPPEMPADGGDVVTFTAAKSCPRRKRIPVHTKRAEYYSWSRSAVAIIELMDQYRREFAMTYLSASPVRV